MINLVTGWIVAPSSMRCHSEYLPPFPVFDLAVAEVVLVLAMRVGLLLFYLPVPKYASRFAVFRN